MLLTAMDLVLIEKRRGTDGDGYGWEPFEPSDRFDGAREIEFFEVASTHRGRGIGTVLVARLVARYPYRRFVAFSEGSDPFWASLGWDRYEHPEGVDCWRPLYIQPA